VSGTRRSLWADAAARLATDRAARISLAILVLLALFATLAPLAVPWHYDQLDWSHMAERPSLSTGHWLGTDRLGRDLLVRAAQGLRISFAIGVLATLVSLVIGVTWGAVAGYCGGRLDGILMRTVDVLYSLPYVFIVILIGSLTNRSTLAVFLGIGAIGWLTMARVVRGEAQGIRQREFITAAIAGGVSTPRILWRHVLPNLAGPVLAYATLSVPQLILIEGFLSFLGLGVHEPRASLGNLLAEGAGDLHGLPWMLMVPGGLVLAIVLALNALGDALRAALDPRQ
jgi:oligopeptide transport system permease protein